MFYIWQVVWDIYVYPGINRLKYKEQNYLYHKAINHGYCTALQIFTTSQTCNNPVGSVSQAKSIMFNCD